MGSGDCWNLPSPRQFPALPEAAQGGHEQPDQAWRQLLIDLNSVAANYRPQGFAHDFLLQEKPKPLGCSPKWLQG